MELSDSTKEYLRLALASHNHCFHDDAEMCYLLILDELDLRRGYVITSEEETQACLDFIADAVVERLILKGMVEVSAVTENGDILMDLTEEGARLRDYINQQEEDWGVE